MTDKNYRPLQKMEITFLGVDEVIPNEYNPNRQSDRDFELLCRSIEEDGFTQPILVQEDTKRIIDGEHRWRAMKVLSATNPRFLKIPCVLVNFTDAQRLISTLRHNRARGSEDINLVANVLQDLKVEGNLEAAADSLLMDDVELQIFLEDIPQAELVLRHEGEELTVGEIEQKLQEEKDFYHKKLEDDRAAAKKDKEGITIQLVMSWFEAKLIDWVLSYFKIEGSKSDALLSLMERYELPKKA